MPKIDYKQIFNAAASALDAASNIDIKAQDTNRYSADITLENGSQVYFTASLEEYSIQLSLAKKSLERKDYNRFMSRFEYNLEQQFFKNFKLESQDSSKEYRIKISF